MMKRLIFVVCVILFASPAFATTYYAQAGSGNMSEIEWDTAAGGGGTDLVWANRQAGDVFDSNGQTGIVVDTDPGVGANKVTLTTGASGGGFAVNAAQTITAHITTGTTHVLQFGAGTFTVAIAGNITGGGTASNYAVYIANTGKTINITGDVAGGSAAAAIYISQAGAINITGNVTGGNGTNGYGVYASSSSTVSVSGTVTGGSAAAVYGLYAPAGSSGTYSVNNATGGSAVSANGVVISSSGACTITGNITNTATASGASGRITYSPAAATNYVKYGTTEYPQGLTAENIKSGVVSGSVTGTYGGGGGGGAWGF